MVGCWGRRVLWLGLGLFSRIPRVLNREYSIPYRVSCLKGLGGLGVRISGLEFRV